MTLQLLEDMHIVENTDARERVTSQEITTNNSNNIRSELLADINESTEKITQILS